MKISFACPSCGASGAVEESFVGKHVRCNHCNHRFPVPGGGGPDDGGYALVGPKRDAAGVEATRPAPSPVFVRSRGDEPTTTSSPRKLRDAEPRSATRRGRSGASGRTWLARVGGLAALALAATALFAPRGMVLAGSALIVLGMALVLVGYGAGAYGAFCEDFLYGFLYLVIPLYTAYYLATRWDEMWRWFAVSSAGVGLVLVGTELLRWSGVAA